MSLVPWWSQSRRHGMEAEIWGLVMVVWVMVAMRFWLGDSWLGASTSASGGDNTGEILSVNLQGENPGPTLNLIGYTSRWLCRKHCFMSADFLLGENLWSILKAMTMLEHRLLLGDVVFGEDEFLMLSWWCLVRCYKKYITLVGLFPFNNSSFFF
jgi:hypothetical protein